MIKPDERVIKGLAVAVRQHPELMVFFEQIREREMSRLPFAVNNTGVAQGRCQVLIEITDFLKQTPELAAKS